ncbi:FG-GAP-like repeat-containing protein [Desulfomonile tiedjei]|uniref:FG-GAP repeat protein n=1 Tax=Desulfomonile tiedjei (strain ATCC 49306 / DSM 6799 / DCB-1) TaxID=706587 RepID=I4C4K8_DESTA|nr:FG-GAP-like repeat-containing protein [Desulfomonile tiedjei]AFM24499.1 FG-GAP repeat protein [Desulfomonile tiedjei DSM 6799]
MRIMPKLQNWRSTEESGRSLVLEQLEERIVLDGAVTDVQDVQDHAADGGQVDSLGWVYVDNGWWQEDNGSGWWWEESSGWFWNENTGWWVTTADGYTWWYHGDHQFFAEDTATGDWLWFDDMNDQEWEPAFTWFADQVNSEWMWVLNDCNGSHYYTDDLNYFYQDHSGGAWYWYDTVNDGVWETAFSWYTDGSGIQVFNDWHSSEYIWGNDFHYIQQHTSSYVNDAPVASVPGAQTVNEDTDLTIPAIYVFDVDSGNNPLQVTLSVTHGTLTLADTTQISWVSGDGTQDTQMVFQGTWSQLNTALHDIVYRPDSNFGGSDSLSIVVDDLGNSGSGGNQTISESVAITVTSGNQAPTSDPIPGASTAEDFGIFDYNVSSYFHDIDSILEYSLGSLTYYGGLTLADLSISSSGIVSFSSAPNANGSVDVQVIASDGQNTTSQTFTFTVTPVNDVPTGTDNTVTTEEDTAHTFIADEFGFSDVDAGDQLQAVQIASLPLAGQLQLNGVDVNLDHVISITDINDGKLSFIPAPDANGTGYATFEFRVFDGTEYSTNYTMTVNVTPVNDAPTGADNTITTDEDTTHAFVAGEFGFSDVDAGDQLQAVQITSLPLAGQLQLNGVDVNLNDLISITDINDGKLSFIPAVNANGTGYATFEFKVFDGTEYSTNYTMTIDVTPVNDAPSGADNTITTDEDTPHTFIAGEFGFSDIDIGDQLQAVQITSLPLAGQLQLNGVDVNLNDLISITDINDGKLSFIPAANANGTGYATFEFRVSDGTDFSTATYHMTVDVTPVFDGFSSHSWDGNGNTMSLVVADINGDGKLDFIEGNYGQASYVYLGDGTGNFSTCVSFQIGIGTYNTRSITVADVNGDTYLDIIQGNYGQQSYVYLGNGSGDFSAVTGTAIGSGTYNTQSITVADLNGDTYLDVIQGNYGQQSYVYLGTGSGDFSAVTGVAIGNGIYNTSSMIVADVNNDTFLDILEGNDGQPNYVYLGTGSGDFSAVTGSAIGSGIYNTNSLALADVNGDTFLDVIQGNYGQQNFVYLGTGTGDFSAVTGTAIGSGTNDTWSIAVGDLNGDGFLDIVEGNGGQINYYYLGNGSGDFSGTTGTPLSSATINTHSLVVANLNGDGYLDIVEGNYDYDNYTYLGY